MSPDRPLLLLSALALASCQLMSNQDLDGDGYPGQAHGGTDCNDEDPSWHPGADDPVDGLDQNCDGGDGLYCVYGSEGCTRTLSQEQSIQAWQGEDLGWDSVLIDSTVYVGEASSGTGGGVTAWTLGDPGPLFLNGPSGAQAGQSLAVVGQDIAINLPGIDQVYLLPLPARESDLTAQSHLLQLGLLPEGHTHMSAAVLDSQSGEGQVATLVLGHSRGPFSQGGGAAIVTYLPDPRSASGSADVRSTLSGGDRSCLGFSSAALPGPDGLDFVAFGDPCMGETSTAGRVLVYAASSSAPTEADLPQMEISAADPLGLFGLALATADADDDGHMDLLVSSPGLTLLQGAIWVLPGAELTRNRRADERGPYAPDDLAQISLHAPPGDLLAGADVAVSPDMDGDGHAELVYSRQGAAHVMPLPHERGLYELDPLLTVEAPAFEFTHDGWPSLHLGDEGLLLVTAHSPAAESPGVAWLYDLDG